VAYRYVDGDPIGKFDPLGLQTITPERMRHILSAHGWSTPRTRPGNSRFFPHISNPEKIQELCDMGFAAPGSSSPKFTGVDEFDFVVFRNSQAHGRRAAFIGLDQFGVPTNRIRA
jgi:hypothetical protein